MPQVAVTPLFTKQVLEIRNKRPHRCPEARARAGFEKLSTGEKIVGAAMNPD